MKKWFRMCRRTGRRGTFVDLFQYYPYLVPSCGSTLDFLPSLRSRVLILPPVVSFRFCPRLGHRLSLTQVTVTSTFGLNLVCPRLYTCSRSRLLRSSSVLVLFFDWTFPRSCVCTSYPFLSLSSLGFRCRGLHDYKDPSVCVRVFNRLNPKNPCQFTFQDGSLLLPQTPLSLSL